jgi:site-specific DNA recombinase
MPSGSSCSYAWRSGAGPPPKTTKTQPCLCPAQLTAARDALPPGAVITAHFYDVESGRRDLDTRGQSTAHKRLAIPIPRDGGIHDLLDEARRPDRRFDAVICESIDRISRRTYDGAKIEHELDQAGVLLFAADEPIILTGKRATALLTRRLKQGVAEWYVLELVEKSRAALEEHTRQGFNTGRPPYGYRAQRLPHPIPAKRAEGKTKTRLLVDPDRAPVVAEIFRLRVAEQLGAGAIASRLNADPDRYPPPERGSWNPASVQRMLRNPKYTGHMIWGRTVDQQAGRRVTKRHNPPDTWIWSPQPTHEPIITRALWEEAQTISRRGSRNGATLNIHSDTKRPPTCCARSSSARSVTGAWPARPWAGTPTTPANSPPATAPR